MYIMCMVTNIEDSLTWFPSYERIKEHVFNMYRYACVSSRFQRQWTFISRQGTTSLYIVG